MWMSYCMKDITPLLMHWSFLQHQPINIMNYIHGSSCEIAYRWMAQNTFNDKLSLVQVMTLCHQGSILFPFRFYSSTSEDKILFHNY